MIDGYTGSANSPTLSWIFVMIAAGLFLAAILVISFILLSRVVKGARQKREALYLFTLQSSLNGLLFHDGEMPEASYTFNISEIKNIIERSSLARQTLINHMVKLKKSISGASAKMLATIYHDLGLHRYSLKKLSSVSWSRRAQGMRELSELDDRDALRYIPKLIATRNRTLREELLLSTIRLDAKNPLGFLDRWDGEITAWMRIHIHHYLSQLDARMIPDFRRWFSSNREDIVMFAVSMARQFQQARTAPGLAKLMSHENPTIVASAIRALTELEAFAVIDDVTGVADRWWPNERVSKAIVIYVGKTGHSKKHFELLEKYLGHEAHNVRLEGVVALTRIGEDGHAILARYNAVNDRDIGALIAHASEPLLR